MLKLELKRILKTRSTWWLAGIVFVLCIFFAFYDIQLSAYYYIDENGQEKTKTGVEAYKLNKEKYSLITGEITPELIAEAVTVKHEVREQYGDDFSLPPKISYEVLGPYSPVYTLIYRSFSDERGVALVADDILPDQALAFYQERLKTLERQLEKKYENAPWVVSYAMSRLDDTGEYLNYTFGIGFTSVNIHLGLCIFLVIMICAVITAPIFSADYANGADAILRCTRQGRRRLALAKLSSAIIISVGIFVLCVGAFLSVVFLAFGIRDNTSAELLNMLWNPHSLTAMGVIGLCVLGGLLTLIAMSSFTLFISSALKNPTIVLAVSIAVALIPTIMIITGADGNVQNWIRFCLPSGGVIAANAITTELISMRFLWVGNFVTWSVYVMLAAAVVQVPLWIGLTVRTYNKYEVT